MALRDLSRALDDYFDSGNWQEDAEELMQDWIDNFDTAHQMYATPDDLRDVVNSFYDEYTLKGLLNHENRVAEEVFNKLMYHYEDKLVDVLQETFIEGWYDGN